MEPKLPSFLRVKNVDDQGKGIFTMNKFIPRGKTIFTSMPYSFGIGGINVDDVKGLCHHCLKMMLDTTASVACSSCRVVGYCSQACLDSGKSLHLMECDGLVKLEEFRGKMPEMSDSQDGRLYWPPPQVMIIARTINRRLLTDENTGSREDEWLSHIISHHTLPSYAATGYLEVKRLVRYLIPASVTDDKIYQTFCAVNINSADVMCPRDTSASALYFEYSLLNHMCQPNCSFENDNSAVSVYALQDIQPESQLCISYLNQRARINVREIRRKILNDSFGFDCRCSVCMDEEVVGSKWWLIDQKKRSLIAPWSRETANEIMEQGWKVTCESECLEKVRAVVLLETTLEVQKLFLDKMNISLILTVWQLLRNYSLLHEYRKGIAHLASLGMVGLSAFFEYASITEIGEIVKIVVRCCEALGMTSDAIKLDKLFLNFFPKVPSSDKLCMTLGSKMSSDIRRFQEMCQLTISQMNTPVELYQIVSCVLNICQCAI